MPLCASLRLVAVASLRKRTEFQVVRERLIVASRLEMFSMGIVEVDARMALAASIVWSGRPMIPRAPRAQELRPWPPAKPVSGPHPHGGHSSPGARV